MSYLHIIHMKRIFTTLYIIFLSYSLFAQDNQGLRGKIYDAVTEEAIPSASITDNSGHWAIHVHSRLACYHFGNY
jgi:hypothetical protein